MKKLLDTIIDIICEAIVLNKDAIVRNISAFVTIKTIAIFFIVPITVASTVYVLYINQETLFIDKFKTEVNNIPQSIDQNLKEDAMYKAMLGYMGECKSSGSFLFYRIEFVDKIVNLQIKYLIQHDVSNMSPKDVLPENIKLQRYLTRKNKASTELHNLLSSLKEGSIYRLDKIEIESSGKPYLEPLASSFSLINKNYIRFTYIPIFHRKLGLIILIGYLDVPTIGSQCVSHDIDYMLDKLYSIYKK